MTSKALRSDTKFAEVFAALLLIVTFSSAAFADAVTDWNARTVQYAATGGRPGPTWVLDVAVVQLAVYDAVQAIEGDYQPYCGSIPGAAGSTTAAVAKAARDVLINRFPAHAVAVNNDYNAYVAGIDPADAGFAVGAAAAQCIITLRSTDGAFPAGWPPYFGGTEIGEWRPAASGPLTFSWLAEVTPFTMRSPDQFRSGPPPRLTSPEYTRAYKEVKDYGAATGSLRSAEQTDLANFWNGNFPGQFNKLGRDLAASENLSVSESSRLFAMVGVSIADSAITAWDCKMAFNFWRPLTAIQFGDMDGNPKTEGDAAWASLVGTPPYSDHTSGANNLTGAAMRVMALFFGGNNMEFEIATTNPGPTQNDTRYYTKFSQVREEVVEARILQGIHFRFADQDARKQGEHLAQWVHSHFFRPSGEKFLSKHFDTETLLNGLE